MQVIKVTGTGLVHTGQAQVEGINLVPVSAASRIVLNDSLDGGSSDKGGVQTGTTYSVESVLYGQQFQTGIYATLTGVGAVAYIYLR